MTVRIRFCTEDDELDATIARGQYGFWATHSEVLLPYGGAIKYDDIVEGWHPTSEPDLWTKQVIVEIPTTKRKAHKFYRFLGYQIGKEYDARPVAGVRCDFEDPKPDCWSCAHLILAALVEAGIVRRPPPFMRSITVRDLMIILAATIDLPAITAR